MQSSLDGTRPARRCRSVKARCRSRDSAERVKTLADCPAQILRHESDRCEGVLI